MLHPGYTSLNNWPVLKTICRLAQLAAYDSNPSWTPLVARIRSMVEAQNPHEQLEHLVAITKPLFPLRNSTKHMSGRNLGRLEPTPSWKYRANACLS